MARNRKRAKARRPNAAPIPAPNGAGSDADPLEAPAPLEHATPDLELAEAQLAVGRPAEPVEVESAEQRSDGDAEPPLVPELEGSTAGGERHPAERPHPGRRLITFAQGSWRELQRVQWPDRRQVMQATGVVIGFVIVAGVFLGVADLLAGHLMNYILTGHFK